MTLQNSWRLLWQNSWRHSGDFGKKLQIPENYNFKAVLRSFRVNELAKISWKVVETGTKTIAKRDCIRNTHSFVKRRG